MIEPRPIAFVEDWADAVFDEAPLIENVLQAFVGRCQACGRCAECQHDGSALVNVLTVEGTLYGDTFCVECFDEEEHEGPVFHLPPLRVIDAFCAWLVQEGWSVEREVDFCDVVARRGVQTLFAEAKGRTAAIGLDVDTLYGQVLRRMPLEDRDPDVRFALVVPSEAKRAVLRVHPRVRDVLRIDVYEVALDGSVAMVG